MKIIAVNGSPRKNKNTAILLEKALEGARSRGADTKLVHLYDLDYKGCASCFACKLKDGKSYGKCAFQDGLTPILRCVEDADAIIMGSPVYLCDVTGQMHAFLERLIFPYITYTKEYPSLFGRKIQTGFIYTMNVTAEQMAERGFQSTLLTVESYLRRAFGHCESLYAFDTLQFDDYEKYVVTIFSAQHKERARAEQFPKDCDNAFRMGRRFAEKT